jgi:hypothetical protein
MLIVKVCMNGERHPSVYICKDNLNEIILCDNDWYKTYIQKNGLYENYTQIGNGYTVGVEGWRLFDKEDVCHQYVKDWAKNLDFKAIASAIKPFPPNVDRERKNKELAAGLKTWMQCWNRDNAHTGQAYLVEDLPERKSTPQGRGGYHLGSSNDWVPGKD